MKKWSADATKNSDALDLEKGAFTWNDPKKIAKSLRNSAEASTRRKAGAYRSAMNMLTFYINRAGKSLPTEQKDILEEAKTKLHILYKK